MNRGFIQIPILIAIIVTAVFSGGAYVAYEVAKPSQNAPQEDFATMTGDTAMDTEEISETIQTHQEENEVIDERDAVIDALQKQVDDLSQKVNEQNIQPQNTNITPKTTIVTLPSGAIVEMDISGNIVSTIKEASQQSYTAPTQSSTQSTQTVPSSALQPKSNLSSLQADLDNIGKNPYLSYSSKKSRQEIAIQNWMKENASDFSIPSYVTQFNVIVTSYGFFYLAQ